MAKRSPKKKAAAAISPPAPKAWLNSEWMWGAGLVIAVVLAYLPVWWAGYIWDDDLLITGNPAVLSPLGLKEIWTTAAADICPLTITTFWFEHALWGLVPVPYHLVNVAMHAAAVITLWRVLRSLAVPGAWLGAALWALHPVQVESVAWITETKNTQSAFFFLLAILFFVRGLKMPGRWDYGLTLLFAALAMASKSSTVVLPVVLLLCAWWVEGRWNARRLIEVAPIFLMSLLAAVVSIWTQAVNGSGDAGMARSWPERLTTAGAAIWFYLGKIVWPHPLMMVYPKWEIDPATVVAWLPLLGVIVLIVILWLRRNAWSRPWFFAFAFFLVALLPVLGLANMTFARESFVADHFQYLAEMGPLALAGAGLAHLGQFAPPGKGWLWPIPIGALLLVLGVVTWQRAWVYQSQETLWTDNIAKNPACWAGYNNLGLDLEMRDQHAAADALYRKALAIRPDYAEAHDNLAIALFKEKQTDAALAEYARAIELKPKFPEAFYNRGYAYFHTDRTDAAILEYRKAIELKPTYAEAYNNLGNALKKRGQLVEAISSYDKALELNPDLAAAHYNLGIALVAAGHRDDAIAQFETALKLDPNYKEVWGNLADALAEAGRLDEAIDAYAKALVYYPDGAEGHNRMGIVLARRGRIPEAAEQFQEAVRLQPDFPAAQRNLAQAQALLQQGQH